MGQVVQFFLHFSCSLTSIQLIIAYINYSIDCWQGLFTTDPLRGIGDSDGKTWSWYKGAVETASEADELQLQVVSETAWASLTARENEAVWSLLPDKMFWEVEGLAKDMLDLPAHFSAAGDKTWDRILTEYIDGLRSTMQAEIPIAEGVNDADMAIQINLPAKLDWLTFNHRNLHFPPILPLVTPGVMDCIVQAFQHIPNALSEVNCQFPKDSDPVITSFNCSTCRGSLPFRCTSPGAARTSTTPPMFPFIS